MEWEHFFLTAGIPPGLAKGFGRIFIENRITFKMLGDLDKVILKELGIVAVGDIISILRCAKTYTPDDYKISVEEEVHKEENNALDEEHLPTHCDLNKTDKSSPPAKKSATIDDKSSKKSTTIQDTVKSAPPKDIVAAGCNGGHGRSNVSWHPAKKREQLPLPSLFDILIKDDEIHHDHVHKKIKVKSKVQMVEVTKSKSDHDHVQHQHQPKREKIIDEVVVRPKKSKHKSKKKETDKKIEKISYYVEGYKQNLSSSWSFPLSKHSHIDKKQSHHHHHDHHHKSKSVSVDKRDHVHRKKSLNTTKKREERVDSVPHKRGKISSSSSWKATEERVETRKERDCKTIEEQWETLKHYRIESETKTEPEVKLVEEKKVRVPGNYVMTYRLNEKSEWDEIGLARVVFCKGWVKCYPVQDDAHDHEILSSEILWNTVFENSKETFMSWTTPASTPSKHIGFGLRFKEKEGFTLVWEEICTFLGKYPTKFLLDAPKTTKYCEEGGPRNGLSFALSSLQGWRSTMEDTATCLLRLQGRNKLREDDVSFFAVFDGHAGSMASSFAADNLIEEILHEIRKLKNTQDDDEVKKAVIQAHLNLDKTLSAIDDKCNSGTTSVSMLVTRDTIYLCNLGDSRGLLCCDGKVIFATEDHKPINAGEMKRIYANQAGFIRNERINGELAVSRGFGDFRFKQNSNDPCMQLVSPKPDVTSFPRSAYSNSFIILASDGVWDVMKNDDIAEFVQEKMNFDEELKRICNKILDLCLERGSRDNMSIVIVKVQDDLQ